MVKQTGQTCVFQLIRSHAKQAYVVGDFNGWSCQAMPMTRQGSAVWELALELQPGVYRFRYLVDGQWLTDYAAFGVERNTSGEYDSVLLIEAPRQPAASPMTPAPAPEDSSAPRSIPLEEEDTPRRRRRPGFPGRRVGFFIPAAASRRCVALAAARHRRMAVQLLSDIDRLTHAAAPAAIDA